MPGPQGRGRVRAGAGLDADNGDVAVDRFGRYCGACCQAAPADRYEDHGQARRLPQQLQGGGTGAGHHGLVVSGRHDRVSVFRSQGAGYRVAVVTVAVIADDAGAQRASAVDLRGGRVAGHNDGDRQV
jgi:hypothetical protein